MPVELQIVMELFEVTYLMTLWMLEHWYLSGPVLLIEYLALMKLWEVSSGKWWERYFKIAGGMFFLPQDAVVNVGLCSVLFLDAPKHFLVTHRMKRYKETGGAPGRFGVNWTWVRVWRHSFSIWLAKLLNPSQQRLDGTDHY